MQMMTPNHPRWEEFCNLLEGPEGCDFREDGDHGPTWHCNGGKDKTFAIKILKQLGFSEEEVEGSCKYFEKHGGYCDCEILFNVRSESKKNDKNKTGISTKRCIRRN